MKLIDNQFSKEAIRNRLIRTATNLWGVKNSASLDPFVRLLMEAFSIEINRAANETQNTRVRILNKLAQLLTPGLLTSPYAAHAIMQAVPVEPMAILPPLSRFKYSKRIATQYTGTQDKLSDIVFMPADSVPLFKGRVAYMASGNRLYQYDAGTGFKESLLLTHKTLPWATCYVGLAMDDAVMQLQGMSFYFDFTSFPSLPWLYQLLSLCKIKVNGNDVEIASGCYYTEKEPNSLEQDIFQGYDVMLKMINEIKAIYDPKFITVKSSCTLSAKAAVPSPLLNSFLPEDIAGLSFKNIRWVEITFPVNYTYEMMESLYVSINAFPVLNRFVKNISTSSFSDIISLRTDDPNERFLAIHKVEDAQGRPYTEIPYNRSIDETGGYYSLRNGGVEKFDERSAQDILNYLIELSRDEVNAFSTMDTSFANGAIGMLDNYLRMLYDKVQRVEKQVKQPSTYMVIEPYDKTGEIIHVEYWVTQTCVANSIRMRSPFASENDFDIERGSAILLTETTGGRDQIQNTERLDAYRYALGSRERLITREDIRNFCRYTLQGKVKEVQFEKGLSISSHPKQGYIRTIDIKIIPHHYNELKQQEWEELSQQLLGKIKSKSPDGINYRILFVENPDNKS